MFVFVPESKHSNIDTIVDKIKNAFSSLSEQEKEDVLEHLNNIGLEEQEDEVDDKFPTRLPSRISSTLARIGKRIVSNVLPSNARVDDAIQRDYRKEVDDEFPTIHPQLRPLTQFKDQKINILLIIKTTFYQYALYYVL